MSFLNTDQINELHRILCEVTSFELAENRSSILKNCMVGKYIPCLRMSEIGDMFASDLIAKFSELYDDDLEGSPILGFINKKLVLITFLENLIKLDDQVRYESAKDFITIELCDKWGPWFEEKLLSYEKSWVEWFSLNHFRERTTSPDKFNRLSNKLSSVEQELSVLSDQLKLETQVYKIIESKAKAQADKRRRNLNCRITSVIVFVLIAPVIYLFREQISEVSTRAKSDFQKKWEEITKLGDKPPEPTTTTPTPTITPTTTPTITITPTPIGYARGWMFIGKIERTSNGDDFLDPPTIYPRMIPQSGAVVEVRETTHIRFNQPQAPDFDYAQQEILGCVVPGEKVEILQVEIVPNRAVWARVQKLVAILRFHPNVLAMASGLCGKDPSLQVAFDGADIFVGVDRIYPRTSYCLGGAIAPRVARHTEGIGRFECSSQASNSLTFGESSTGSA